MSTTLIPRNDIEDIVNYYVKLSKSATTTIDINDFGLYSEVSDHPDFNKACLPKTTAGKSFGTGERFSRLAQVNGIIVKIIDQEEEFPIGYFRQDQLKNINNDIGFDGYFDFKTQQHRMAQLKLLTTLKLTKEECLKDKLLNSKNENKKSSTVVNDETKVDEYGKVVLPKSPEKPSNIDEFEMVDYYDDDVDTLLTKSSYIERDDNMQADIMSNANLRILATVRNTADSMQVNFLKVLPLVQKFCNKILAKRKLAIFIQRLYKCMLYNREIQAQLLNVEVPKVEKKKKRKSKRKPKKKLNFWEVDNNKPKENKPTVNKPKPKKNGNQHGSVPSSREPTAQRTRGKPN